jgi:two-component system, chemotaxis family, response regulator PixG
MCWEEPLVDHDLTNQDPTVITKLFHDLKRAQAQQATGKFVITPKANQTGGWQIYFYLGRIVWATGGIHPLRRWLRILRAHCPELLNDQWSRKIIPQETVQPNHSSEYWEVQILSQAFHSDHINLAQAKAVVQSYVQEVFFGLIEQSDLTITWTALKKLPQQFVWLDVDQVVQRSSDLCVHWREALSQQIKDCPEGFSPDFAVTIKQDLLLKSRVSPLAYQAFKRLLNGKNTFWDLALKMQKPLIPIVHSLFPLIRDGVLQLEEIPDLLLPAATPIATPIGPPEPIPIIPKGVIACIDDSPMIGEILTTILQPHGYTVISILDPLQGLSVLLKHKPKLIFLDLIMPSTNGYELCAFLRKTVAFRELPIVMLTGHDGVLDRIRAKVSGSTDFLSKPPEPDKVLQVIQKYLENPRDQPHPSGLGPSSTPVLS